MNKILTIPSFATKEECDYILNKCINESSLSEAGVYNSNDTKSLRVSRKSKVSFLLDIGDVGERIINKVIEHVGQIKGHTPSLDYFQFTKYDKGDYFDWHADSNDTIYKDRFYTIVLQLTNEYVGGEFQLMVDDKEITLERGVGNLFIFPSEIIHRVKPITENIRYSLVNWLKLKPLENFKKTLI